VKDAGKRVSIKTYCTVFAVAVAAVSVVVVIAKVSDWRTQQEQKKAIKDRVEQHKKEMQEFEDRMSKGTDDTPQVKRWTRDDFKGKVLGMTQDQVLRLLGKPDSTSEILDTKIWYYPRITYDPISGKPDFQVQLTFVNGKVTFINFI